MEPIQNIVSRHNGTSPMCNQFYRTRPDDGPAAQAHSAAPVGASDRPCDAMLLAVYAVLIMLCCWRVGQLAMQDKLSRPQSSLVLARKRKHRYYCPLPFEGQLLIKQDFAPQAAPRVSPSPLENLWAAMPGCKHSTPKLKKVAFATFLIG